MDNRIKKLPLNAQSAWKEYLEDRIFNSTALPLILNILKLEIPYRCLGFRNFKEFLDIFHINIQQQLLNSCYPPNLTPKAISLNVGDEVQYSYKGNEIKGTVKWLGVVCKVTCAGIEFSEPIGFPYDSSSSLPFQTKPGYARIVPLQNISKVHEFANTNLTPSETQTNYGATTWKSRVSFKKNLTSSFVTIESANNSNDIIPGYEKNKTRSWKSNFPTLYKLLCCYRGNKKQDEDKTAITHDAPKRKYREEWINSFSRGLSTNFVDGPCSSKSFAATKDELEGPSKMVLPNINASITAGEDAPDYGIELFSTEEISEQYSIS